MLEVADKVMSGVDVLPLHCGVAAAAGSLAIVSRRTAILSLGATATWLAVVTADAVGLGHDPLRRDVLRELGLAHYIGHVIVAAFPLGVACGVLRWHARRGTR